MKIIDPALLLLAALAAPVSTMPGSLFVASADSSLHGVAATDGIAADNQTFSEANRLLLDYRIECLKKNRPGTCATDFSFANRNGAMQTLHQSIKGSTQYVLLTFFDPDCTECHQLANRLAADRAVNAAIASGKLQILFITPIETEPEQWAAFASTLPSSWTVGYAPNVDADELYILPSIPTLYLLDGHGRVLIRNLRF